VIITAKVTHKWGYETIISQLTGRCFYVRVPTGQWRWAQLLFR